MGDVYILRTSLSLRVLAPGRRLFSTIDLSSVARRHQNRDTSLGGSKGSQTIALNIVKKVKTSLQDYLFFFF